MVPKWDYERGYASKAQHVLRDVSLFIRFSGESEDRIWFNDEDKTTVKSQVESVAYSPDGTKILTGSDDRTARLWDTESGKLVAIFEGHKISVRKVAFSPDGCLIITCDRYGQVRFWQLRGPKLGRLLGVYSALYEIGAVYWQDATHVVLADKGGPEGRPHFYRLKLEGEW